MITKLDLPENWIYGIMVDEYDVKMGEINRFEFFISPYGLIVMIKDSITGDCWGCNCSKKIGNYKQQLRFAKKFIRNFLKQGNQLTLF